MKLKKDATVMTSAKIDGCVGWLHKNCYWEGGLTFGGVEWKFGCGRGFFW